MSHLPWSQWRLAHLALTAAALGLSVVAACAEEPTPNHVPELVAGSPTVTCEDLQEANLGPVLAGGSVQVIDENLVAVTVDLGGIETIALSGPTDAALEPEAPQTWTFAVDTARRLVCSPDLVLVFTAHDEEGDSAVAVIAAQ